MDDQLVGRIVRALRRRLGWRQVDVATRAGCSQSMVSLVERGHLEHVSLPVVRRILVALDASLLIEVRWRAGALERLLDEEHALLAARVADSLRDAHWEVAVEVTYSEFGERGSIDILAFEPISGTVLVVEIKTDLPAIEATLRKLDEKVRLAPAIARARFNWKVRQVARLLVMPELSTLRRRVDRHARLLERVFPHRGRTVRAWLTKPEGSLSGLWFLSPSGDAAHIRSRGGRDRVRRPSSTSISGDAAA